MIYCPRRELAERESACTRRALIAAFVLALLAGAVVSFSVPLVGGYCLALIVAVMVFIPVLWLGMH